MLEWLERLEQEHDNLRVALQWALSSDIVAGLKIASDLFWFWHIRGLFEEVVALLEKLLAAELESRAEQTLTGQRALQRARGLHALAHHLAYNTGHPLTAKRVELCEESIAILRGLGSPARQDLAVSILKLLWVQNAMNQPSRLREEMIEIFESEKNAFYLSELYWFRFGFPLSEGNFDAAEDILNKSMALSNEIGDLDGLMSRSSVLSELAWYKGDGQRADALLEDAIRYSHMIKNRWNEPEYQLALAKRAMARGEYLETARLAQESLRKYSEFNYSIGINMSLETLLRNAWSQGELEQTGSYAHELLVGQPGQALDPANFFQKEAEVNASIYLGRASITLGDFLQAKTLLKKTHGSILNEGNIDWWRLKIELLLAWIALLTQYGDYLSAARLLGAVDSIYQRTKVSYSPRERQEHQENRGVCLTALGEEAFGAAIAAGQAMTLSQAIGWIESAM